MTRPGTPPPPRVGWWVKRGRNVIPDAGSFTLTGYPPTVFTGLLTAVQPDVGAMSLSGSAPTVDVLTPIKPLPPAGVLTLTGLTPTVEVLVPPVIQPPKVSLTLTGKAPTISLIPAPITLISSGHADGASMTMPAHDIGDLLLMCAFGTNFFANFIPTLATGWTYIVSGAASWPGGCGGIIGYKFATSSSEASGTWTNADFLMCNVYRYVSGIGASAGSNMGDAATSTLTFPALTLQGTDDRSWVVMFGGTTSNATSFPDPTTTGGYPRRINHQGSADDGVCYDTGTGVSTGSGGVPAVVATGSSTLALSRTPSVTFSGYSAQENDVIVFFCTVTGATSTGGSNTGNVLLTMPTGWVDCLDSWGSTWDIESGTHEAVAVYHIVTAGEVAHSTFTATNLYDAGHSGNVLGIALRGVDTETVIDDSDYDWNSVAVTDADFYGLSGFNLGTNSLVVGYFAKAGTGSYVKPDGWTEQITINSHQFATVCTSDTPTVEGVDVPEADFTFSAADQFISYTIAFNGAATGGGVWSGATASMGASAKAIAAAVELRAL